MYPRIFKSVLQRTTRSTSPCVRLKKPFENLISANESLGFIVLIVPYKVALKISSQVTVKPSVYYNSLSYSNPVFHKSAHVAIFFFSVM